MAEESRYSTANKLWDFLLGKGNAISQLPEELPAAMEQLGRTGSALSGLSEYSLERERQLNPLLRPVKSFTDAADYFSEAFNNSIDEAKSVPRDLLNSLDLTGEALANVPENTGRAMELLRSFFSENLPRTRAALGETPEAAQEVAGPAPEVVPVGRTLSPEDIMRMVNSGETISLGANDSVESKRFTKSSGGSDKIRQANEDAQAEILKIQMREAKAPLMAKLRSGKITPDESGMLAELIKREDDFLNQDKRKDKDLLSIIANTVAGRPSATTQRDETGRTVIAPPDPQISMALDILRAAGISEDGIKALLNQGG